MQENGSPSAPKGDSVPALVIVVVWGCFSFVFFLVSTSEDSSPYLQAGLYVGGTVCGLLAILGLGKWLLEVAGFRESDLQVMPGFVADFGEDQDADDVEVNRPEKVEEPGLILRLASTAVDYFPGILILGLGVSSLFIFLGPAISLRLIGCVAIYLGIRHLRRYRSRDCPKCRIPMELLGEDDDDAHLSKSEILEEKLKSANYDVWLCNGCRRSQTVRYGAFFSKYSKCPSCGAKTRSVSTTVISQPTHTMSGTKKITESCDNCDFRKQNVRSISSTGS